MIEAGTRDVVAIAASVAGATALALVLYRRTTPRQPRWLRVGLGALRWAAALIILLLVTDPAIQLKTTTRSEPLVAVVIDDSRSMAYPADGPKLDRITSVLSGALMDRLRSRADVRLFTFSDMAGEVADGQLPGLEARGSRTDLAAGITSIIDALQRKPSAFVVLSDGAVNFGEDALHFASSLRVPIHTVSLAEPGTTPDISIDRIETSGTAYADSDVPVLLHVSGRHTGEVETALSIRDSSGTVFSRRVVIPGTGATIRVDAKVEAGKVGTHGFEAALAPFEGEGVVANNSMIFSLRVIRGKIRVCLAAPRPSWDFAFARRSLEADPNIEVRVMFTSKTSPGVHLGNEVGQLSRVISDLDVIAVLGDADLGPAWEDVGRFASGGGGLLLMGGTPSRVPVGMSPFVIGASSGKEADLFSARITDAGVDHEIVSLAIGHRGRSWSELPPVPIDDSIRGSREESTVLLSGVSGNKVLPLVAVMRYGGGRVVGLAAFDLWRWDLIPKGFGIESAVFTSLLVNSVGWLSEREELRRVALSSSKPTYLWGEPVDLFARVTDESLKPLAEATVDGWIKDAASGQNLQSFAMVDRGAGSHSVRIDLLSPGRYEAAVVARTDSGVFGEERLEFRVDDRGLEDFDFDGDTQLLREIATATGGGAYTIDQTDRLAAELNPGSAIIRTFRELRFRLSLGSFLLLVGILGMEWLLRKRRMLL